jgi:hypothetical protein
MAFTFTVKTWRDMRPSEAKDLGVGDAMKNVLAAFAKSETTMTVAECDTAADRMDTLSTAFTKAAAKLKPLKSKEATTSQDKIKLWEKELDKARDALKTRKYQIDVGLVSAKYKEVFDAAVTELKKEFIAAAKAAKEVETRDFVPAKEEVVKWVKLAQDCAVKFSKTYIPTVAREIKKIVKVEDVALPPTLKESKVMVDKLTGWCTLFAEAAKKKTQKDADALDDKKEVEKQLKAVFKDFQDLEGKMKGHIGSCNNLSTAAKATAEKAKVEVTKPENQAVSKKLAETALTIKENLETVRKTIKTLSDSFQKDSGPLAKALKAVQGLPAFDEKKFGGLIKDRTHAAEMSVQQCEGPLANVDRQLDRIRLMFSKSSYQGYAAKL